MSAETSLWSAVISQAIVDATSFSIATEGPIGTIREREIAQRWLTRPNVDFAHACIRAGVDEGAVRALATKEIEAFNWMLASGQTARRPGPRASDGRARA